VRDPEKRRLRRGRLSRGEGIASLSALVLIVATFFDWYEVEPLPHSDLSRLDLFDTGGNAWHSFEVAPWLLVLVAFVALGAALLVLRRSRWRPAIAPSAVVALAGGVATVGTLFRILFPPNFGPAGIPLVVNVEFGAYLALAASLGVACGGYRAMGERGTSFAKIADALSKPGGAKPWRRPEPSPRSPARPSSRRRSRSSSD
jgi:hypothetical protein